VISFIVPAHNEEACLGRTLEAIRESADFVAQPYEIIVVNDASTDSTAEIARQNNARVVDVNHRQIAATRNSGARAAAGDRLFFVDADTIINSSVVAAALRAGVRVVRRFGHADDAARARRGVTDGRGGPMSLDDPACGGFYARLSNVALSYRHPSTPIHHLSRCCAVWRKLL